MNLDRAGIEKTYRIVRSRIRRTPILEVEPGDLGIQAARVTLKLEYLQLAGSFKSRGAFANLLLRDIGPAGVAAASGGNHGAAVATAASRLGVPAHIFIPSVSPQSKIDRIRSAGADLVIAGDRYDDALQTCSAYVAKTGAVDVHAFDQPETILGQGSVGLEVEEQVGAVDTVLVAVGGGGLIAGIASWFGDTTKVVGIEPVLAPTLTMALEAGKPVDAPADGVAADSLAPRRVGDIVFPLAQRHVDEMRLVADDAIVEAQRTLWQVCRVLAEPGGATAFAALMSGSYVPEPDEHVVVIVSGANTDAIEAISRF